MNKFQPIRAFNFGKHFNENSKKCLLSESHLKMKRSEKYLVTLKQIQIEAQVYMYSDAQVNI